MHDPTIGAIENHISDVTEYSVEDIAIQTEAEATIEERGIQPAVLPQPMPTPIPILARRPVSGRYRGAFGSFQLELRVDIDRIRPMRKLSGDFFSVSGSTTSYAGSFVVNNPAITVTATNVICRGTGSYTFNASAPVVQIEIQRRTLLQPQAPALIKFFKTNNQPGAQYNCAFESIYFRTVRIETDKVSDVTTPVFTSYNTGALSSGGPARPLSVVSAYAEAGIQMIPTAGSNVIPIGASGVNGTWSNAEMHAAMVGNMSIFQNIPQWAVWLLVAQRHDLGSGLLGIMFDQIGPQRQGCAVFHAGLGGVTPQALRLQLNTYVHELGHCFNLMHSWQKSLATPPGADRPASLSYMNYPWLYPQGGEPGFWASYAFQFDDGELIHLRHAFRNNIIMGGNPFTIGAGMVEPDLMSDLSADQSGLKFEIAPVSKGFSLGEPVVLNLSLAATNGTPMNVHRYLHPNMKLTMVAIEKPNGQLVSYEPFIDHLVNGGYCELKASEKQITDSAYIGFGKRGFYFDQPGNYKIRAVYHAMDGSRILSNVASLRVHYPVTEADEEIAELLSGEEQGLLFYMLGSDADTLAKGRAALQTILEKYGKRPIANYIRFVLGVNAAREFKTITSVTEEIKVRPADTKLASELLTASVRSDSPIDPISKVQGLNRLAEAQSRVGDTEGLSKTQLMAVQIPGGNIKTEAQLAMKSQRS
jgi:hypothetical protein